MTTAGEMTPSIRDAEKLAAWMDAEGLAVGAPLEFHYLSGGSQNEIYEIRRGELHCAMRIPPPSSLNPCVAPPSLPRRVITGLAYREHLQDASE